MSNELAATPDLTDNSDADSAPGDMAAIEYGLKQRFEKEGHRIVFWNDEEAEFAAAVNALALPDATLLRLDEIPALAVKIQLEITDCAGRYLLYAPFAPPPIEGDWLLDIREYSASFQADRASMLLSELGLGESQALRGHINARRKFFNSRERTNRLAKIAAAGDGEADLDRKMLAVLARSELTDAFSIITTLYHGLYQDQVGGNGDVLDAEPTFWGEVERFDLLPSFWDMVERTFGYREDEPRLRNLLIRLLTSDFARSCPVGKVPASLTHLTLPQSFWPDIAVCLSQWRDSSSRSVSYDRLSREVAEVLHLRSILLPFSPEELAASMTFLEVEKHIVAQLRDRIIESVSAQESDAIKALVASRRAGHWAAQNAATSEVPRAALRAAYDALQAADDLLMGIEKYAPGFSFPNMFAAYRAYEEELFHIDTHYRHFCENARCVRLEGWDLIKTLCEKVESAYGVGFLSRLGLAWSELIENELLEKWQIQDVPNQYNFFQSQIKKVLDAGEVKRVFVIISDAFRYEAAHELTAQLNGKYRFRATLSSQLGVLPSYTPLGMGSLLPHNSLSYNAKGDVLVDGQSTKGLEYRSKVLQSVKGLAVGADELMQMSREAGRAFIRESQVVYIYHDDIDSVGEKAATEDDTFTAARTAINELGKLVSYIINRFNGGYILVTADHGFLYQETSPNQTHKSRIEDEPAGKVRGKKRYLIGHDLPSHPKTHRGSTSVTAHTAPGVDGPMDFWVPRSINRFHFSGGAKYLHGGAMPQEIVVPIIRVREKEGSAAVSTKVRPVKVHFVGASNRITTNRYRVQLIQTEAASERIQAVTLQVGIYDGETLISSLESVTFDSSSSDMNERTKTVPLSLQSGSYDKKKPYSVILRNASDNIEVQRSEVTIDLAFSADF